MKNFLLSIVLIVSIAACSAGANNQKSSNVLVITDIHLDPFNSCGTFVTESSKACVKLLVYESNPSLWKFPYESVNEYGEETNNEFFITGLNNLEQIAKNNRISSIFITGDLLSHDFPTQFADYVPNGTQDEHTELAINTMNYVLYKISQAVPNAKMYYILGNNDTDQSDYSYPTQHFMKLASERLSKYMAYPDIFKSNFANGGYYMMPFSESVNLIGLNMNPLTIENEGNESDDKVAIAQHQWLELQLNASRELGKNVIIIQHEPYGANVYDIEEDDTPDFNIQDKYQELYLSLYKQNNDIIKNYYFAHYHMEDYMVIESIFAMSTLGFSVDFYNNPGFKILQINNEGQLVDFTTYYSQYEVSHDLLWSKLYNFNETYQANNPVKFFANISINNSQSWNSYVNNYGGGTTFMPYENMPINFESTWQYYNCQIKYADVLNYWNCIGG